MIKKAKTSDNKDLRLALKVAYDFTKKFDFNVVNQVIRDTLKEYGVDADKDDPQADALYGRASKNVT